MSNWIVAHPVLWSGGLAVVLVVIGVTLSLPPILVLAAGAAAAVANVLHARRRGYCPVPTTDPDPATGRGDAR